MAYNIVTVKNWQELTALFDTLKVHENLLFWYLRGQADASWSLIPSFLRTIRFMNPDAVSACEMETTALKLFQSQAHLYLKSDIIDRNSWACIAWWSLMQHYSCPTRLLDWTRSPYVATYFAVNQHSNRDGAIWYFPAPLLEKIITTKYGPLRYDETEEFFGADASQAVYPLLGFQHTERSAAQQGVFTVATHIMADHGTVIRKALAQEPHKNRLTKVIIPAACKFDFLSRLHTMNITAKTLFPGIDGIGRSVSEIICLRTWQQAAYDKKM